MSDLPPPPPGFEVIDEQPKSRPKLSVKKAPPPPEGFNVLPNEHPDAAPLIGRPTGAVHDGDTFALDSGQNARLYGVDAFELNQTGRSRDGGMVALGQQARVALGDYARPDATVTPTGAVTYGRPVASLDRNGDAATSILHQGLGIATPEYLKADPRRLGPYMEEERDARLNRRGAWATAFEQPSSFRHGRPDPWAKPVPGKEGESEAVFWDDPLPAQGVRPEIADKYISIWQDPTSTPADLMAFAKTSGFMLDPAEVEKAYKGRETRGAGSEVTYRNPPRVLTDHKDGATGAALRGVADPFNVLDETGALADSLLPGDRENLWSSDRRFGDVYANNLDQNRSILAFDDAKHPYARFGGQLVGGLIAPGASIEGVGFGAARGILEAGGTRYAAEQAARNAVVKRLGLSGAVEGAGAGLGQGEDWKSRVQGGLVGAPIGLALGVGTGLVAPHVAKLVGRPFSGMAGTEAERSAQDLTDGALDAAKAGTQNGATPNSVGLTDDAARIGGGQEPTVRLYRAEGDATNSRQGIDTTEGHRWFTTDPEIAANYASKRRGEVYALDLPESRANDLLKGGHTANIPDAEASGMRQFTDLKAARAEAEADIERGSLSSDDYKAHVRDRLADGPSDIPPPPAGFSALDDTHPEAVGLINREAPGPSPVMRPREPVAANTQAMDETSGLGPKSILSFVPPKGEPGVSVINQDGQLAVAVYRDGDGVARGAAQVPLTPEARETFDGASVYVAPDLRRQGVATRLYDALEQEGHPIGAQSGAGDLTPDGAGFVSAWRARDPAQAMDNETARASIDGPSFTDDVPAPPAGFTALDNAHPDAVGVMGRTPAQVAAAGETVSPADILPVPSSAVGSLEEAERIAAGRVSPVRAPNEADVLERRNIPSPRDGSKTIPKRGPVDMVTWLRTQGGIRAQSGELEHYGIDNAARKGVDFAGGENRFGPLVSREGMNYDDAAERAWEAGFFPDHVERPTVSEFLDTLNATHSGNNRAFRTQDLPEVDAYEAARSRRHEVEAAQQEGTPLVQDRGEPVGLDDLEANAPPVHAYEEWGDNAPTMAGNIRLDKLDSPQSIARAIANTHAKVGGFDDATRGRITHAETESLASELGMTADDLLRRRKGQALNAEEALAARQILSRSATDLVNLAKRFHAADNPGDEMERKFSEAWMRHVAIQEQVAGATAEAGRALSAFRMAADSRAVNGRVLGALEAMPGGSGRLKDVAGAIVDMERVGGGPGEIAKFTAKAIKPRFRDKVVELWYNSLLSGPQTHAVNIMGNTMTALAQVPEHVIAAGVGAARKLLPGQAETDQVLFSEAGARIVGLLQGTKEGLAQAARTFRTGEAADAVTKVEQQSQNAIPGKLGSVIRTPTRALAAEDELFKAMARRMELAGLAVRTAGQEGLKGPAAKQRAADLLANPTDDLLEKSFDYGRYLTFQRPLEFGSLSQAISNATNNFTPLKLIIPFVRTPVNILKFAGERSPAAPFVKSWRADVAAGGARRDLAIAKASVGSGVMALSMQMAADGHVTGGGPADPAARSLLQADGWQPYSVKVGDKYYSYSRLDPFSTTLGVAADFAELQSHMTEKQRSNVAALLLTSTVKNLSNKVWFSGVSDLSDAISDPERYGDNFVQRLAGSLAVPGGVAQIARTVDPTMRETESILDSIRARIPGASKTLEAKRDVWGKPIVREGGLGPDLMSPIATSSGRNDTLSRLLLDSDIHVGKPSRKLGGERLPLALYGKYREQVGILARPQLLALGQSAEWPSMDHDDKQAAVSNILTRSNREARGMLGLGKPSAARGALGGGAQAVPPPPPGFR